MGQILSYKFTELHEDFYVQTWWRICASFNELGHHYLRQWLITCLTLSHYLNQRWSIVDWTPRNPYTKTFIQETSLENIVPCGGLTQLLISLVAYIFIGFILHYRILFVIHWIIVIQVIGSRGINLLFPKYSDLSIRVISFKNMWSSVYASTSLHLKISSYHYSPL